MHVFPTGASHGSLSTSGLPGLRPRSSNQVGKLLRQPGRAYLALFTSWHLFTAYNTCSSSLPDPVHLSPSVTLLFTCPLSLPRHNIYSLSPYFTACFFTFKVTPHFKVKRNFHMECPSSPTLPPNISYHPPRRSWPCWAWASSSPAMRSWTTSLRTSVTATPTSPTSATTSSS